MGLSLSLVGLIYRMDLFCDALKFLENLKGDMYGTYKKRTLKAIRNKFNNF
jgi:hypothetical protein